MVKNPKRLKNQSSNCTQISLTSGIPNDTSTNSLKSIGYVAIFKFYKNKSTKIIETLDAFKGTAEVQKSSKIKDEKQVINLTESMSLSCDAFGKYEKDTVVTNRIKNIMPTYYTK